MPSDSYHRAATLNNNGLAAYCLNDYSAALDSYRNALELTLAPLERRDLYPIIYVNIANIYFSQDDTQPAWQALRTAHEINPSNDHALLGLAVLHAAEGQWDEALTIWRSLASEYPFFADIDQVVERYYRWNPPMADLVHQIAARLDPATA